MSGLDVSVVCWLYKLYLQSGSHTHSLNVTFSADVLAAFTWSFNIGIHYGGLIAVEIWVVPGVAGTFVGSDGFIVYNVGPIQSPYRVLASL